MRECPFCIEMSEDSILICNCGYNFEENEITDRNKIIGWFNTPEPDEHWSKKIERLYKIHDFQIKNASHVVKSKNLFWSWSGRRTAKLLNKSPTHISADLRLAEAFSKYPDLRSCKNKTEAKNRLNELEGKSSIKSKGVVFESEEELHNYLENNWDISPFGDEWILKGSKYKTNEVGEIDLLAINREGNKWLVVELKKDQTSDETVGQILRYMGFINRRLISEDDVVEGLIIARTVDKHILFALDFCPDVRLMRYTYSNGNLVFKEIDRDFESNLIDFDKLSKVEKGNYINRLKELLEQENKDGI